MEQASYGIFKARRSPERKEIQSRRRVGRPGPPVQTRLFTEYKYHSLYYLLVRTCVIGRARPMNEAVYATSSACWEVWKAKQPWQGKSTR